MKYQQKLYPFYNPTLVRMSMGSLNFVVNYMDMLDESCVEFEHVHDCYEIYYCLSGVQNVIVEGSRLSLISNSFLILRPGVHHYTVYEPRLLKRYVVFIFTPPTISTAKNRNREAQSDEEFLASALRHFTDHSFYLSKDLHNCESVIRRLEKESETAQPGKSQMVSALYQEYLISIFRHLVSGECEEPNPANVNQAIELTKYMHANYNKNISVQDVADVFYMSPRHVNRVFEEYFGQSFKRALNLYRINYAKNYLIDTSLSIAEIAEKVGFSSPKVLHRLFKENEGMTLIEFRSRYKNTEGY